MPRLPAKPVRNRQFFLIPPAARPASLPLEIATKGEGGKPRSARSDQSLSWGRLRCNMNAERFAPAPRSADPQFGQAARFISRFKPLVGGSMAAILRCSAVWSGPGRWLDKIFRQGGTKLVKAHRAVMGRRSMGWRASPEESGCLQGRHRCWDRADLRKGP